MTTAIETAITDEQRTLLTKLASIAEMIEQHKTTIFLLEREQLGLRHRLALTGYRAPAVEVAE